MAISTSRSGATATVTITIDVSDILALSVSNAEKKRLGLVRAQKELDDCVAQVIDRTDAQINAAATAASDLASTEAARLTALRPSGTF